MKIIPAVVAASPEIGVFCVTLGDSPQHSRVPAPFLTSKVSVEQVNYVLDLVPKAYEIACERDHVSP